jgi:hypothetical protein
VSLWPNYLLVDLATGLHTISLNLAAPNPAFQSSLPAPDIPIFPPLGHFLSCPSRLGLPFALAQVEIVLLPPSNTLSLEDGTGGGFREDWCPVFVRHCPDGRRGPFQPPPPTQPYSYKYLSKPSSALNLLPFNSPFCILSYLRASVSFFP